MNKFEMRKNGISTILVLIASTFGVSSMGL